MAAETRRWSLEEVAVWQESRPARWTSEKIQELREWRGYGLEFKQIGALYYGVSGERIRQLVGDCSDIYQTRFQYNQERVLRHVDLGKTDGQIATAVDLSVPYVGVLRNSAGVERNRPPKKHTQESAIWNALWWYICFGYTPWALDWNPAGCINAGQPERAQRFYEFREIFGTPTLGTVQELFGSWSEFNRRTGLPVPLDGPDSHGRWKTGKLAE